MTENSKHLRIELTPDQKSQIAAATGKQAEAIELSVEELEQRIAPRHMGPPTVL